MIVQINTTLGDFKGSIVEIQGDLATIKTEIGEIKVMLISWKPFTLEDEPISLWLLLAIFASIVFITNVVLLLRKRKKSRS